MEWVAEFVRFGVVGAFAGAAVFDDAVFAEALVLEVGVDLGEGFLADFAVAAGGEFPGVAGFADVAGVFEDFEEVFELVEGFAGVFAEELFEGVDVDFVEVAAVLGALELAFEFIHVLHFAHEVHGGLEVELFVAAEGVLVAEVVHGVEGFEVGGEFGEAVHHAGVGHAVVHEVLELLAHVAGEGVHEVLHHGGLLLHLFDEFIE